MAAQLLACVRWRASTTGNHYCEYYDKRTGEFLSIGIAQDAWTAERKAASRLPERMYKAFPQLATPVAP